MLDPLLLNELKKARPNEAAISHNYEPHPALIIHYYLVNAAATPPSTVTIHPVVFAALDDDKNAIDSAIS